MIRILWAICLLLIISCCSFIISNSNGITNCSQELNLTNSYFKSFDRQVNNDNTSSYIRSGGPYQNNESKGKSSELFYVSEKSIKAIDIYDDTDWMKNSEEQNLNLSAKVETNDNIHYADSKSETLSTLNKEEPHTSSSESSFLFDKNYLEKNSENIELLRSNDIGSARQVFGIGNESKTSPLPKTEVSCISDKLSESTFSVNESGNDLNGTLLLNRGKLHCNVSSMLSTNVPSEVQDRCYTYIHEMHDIVHETYGKLVQIHYFATELKTELDSIQNHQILFRTQSEDQVTHVDGCTLDGQYQSNWNGLKETKSKMDHGFHEVERKMLDLDQLFNVFEDLRRDRKPNSKVLQRAGIEILTMTKTMNILMNRVQRESNSFLNSVPDVRLECN